MTNPNDPTASPAGAVDAAVRPDPFEAAFAGAARLLRTIGNEQTYIGPHLSKDIDDGVCLFWVAGDHSIEVTVNDQGVADYGRFRIGPDDAVLATDPAEIETLLRERLARLTSTVRAAWSAQDAGNERAVVLMHADLAAAAAEPPLLSDEAALVIADEAIESVEATLAAPDTDADTEEGFAWHDSAMHE